MGSTTGLTDVAAIASLPLTRWDTLLSLYAELSESDIVEEPLNVLNVESKSETYEVSLSHPFYRTPQREFSAGVSLVQRQSKTFLLGRPFSFTANREDNVTKIAIARFTQSWLDRSPEQIIALNSTLSVGVNVLNVKSGGPEPNRKFVTWLGQAQWAQRFALFDSQLITRAAVQLSNDPLPSIERFVLGGMDSVRDYRTNQLVRDEGFVASVEARIPFLHIPIQGISKDPRDGRIELAPFVDVGKGWNKGGGAGTQDRLVSVGLGLRWVLGPGFEAELYGGWALDNIPNADHDIQDSGGPFSN